MISSFLLEIPPAWVMICGAFLPLFLKGGIQRYVALIIPIITLALVWQVTPTMQNSYFSIAGFELQLMYMHSYTHIFATIFCIAAFGGVLFALYQAKIYELCAALFYAGSAIGVTFSGDLISMFIYWEMMAIGSMLIVFLSGRERARVAGYRYAAMHFMGGVLLMGGIIYHIVLTGDMKMTSILAGASSLGDLLTLTPKTIAAWFMLIGILVNAAAPPFSAWLADSYPGASPSGAVFLSAFTTKTAVFVLLTLFAGAEVLIYVGMFMVFYGIIYAILENDMRRILAYSIMNQVGFMVTGIGIGTTLAIQGVALHAFCHIIYKALLLMSAGSVMYMTGETKCSKLGGLYHSMKLTAICGIIGALAISAFPLTSGFVSKSLITSAAANQGLMVVWLLLVAASAGVFLHAGIKFPWFVFFQKDSGLRPKDPPWNMRFAMILFSALCIIPAIPGATPYVLYWMIPGGVDYQAYTLSHVVTQLQLLLFSGLAFFMMLPLLKRTETISLDVDWLYRVPLMKLYIILQNIAVFCYGAVSLLLQKLIGKVQMLLSEVYDSDGVLSRAWPVGVTATWVAASLALYIALYYFL